MLKIWKLKVFRIRPFKSKSNGRPLRLLRFRGHFRGHRGQNFKIIYFLSLFLTEFSSFWISRSFDLGNLGVFEKSPVNIFNDFIFEISLVHWSKCTIECAIRLTLILKSTQARCGHPGWWDRQKCSLNWILLNIMWPRLLLPIMIQGHRKVW